MGFLTMKWSPYLRSVHPCLVRSHGCSHTQSHPGCYGTDLDHRCFPLHTHQHLESRLHSFSDHETQTCLVTVRPCSLSPHTYACGPRPVQGVAWCTLTAERTIVIDATTINANLIAAFIDIWENKKPTVICETLLLLITEKSPAFPLECIPQRPVTEIIRYRDAPSPRMCPNLLT